MAHKFTRKLHELLIELKANGPYDISIHDAAELQKLFDVGSAMAELLVSQSEKRKFPVHQRLIEKSISSRINGLRSTLQDGLK